MEIATTGQVQWKKKKGVSEGYRRRRIFQAGGGCKKELPFTQDGQVRVIKIAGQKRNQVGPKKGHSVLSRKKAGGTKPDRGQGKTWVKYPKRLIG